MKALARVTDPQESRDAAARVDTDTLERIVVSALRIFGPMTEREVAERTGKERVTLSPRFAPLERRGIIERTGEQRGRAAVWRVVERYEQGSLVL